MIEEAKNWRNRIFSSFNRRPPRIEDTEATKTDRLKDAITSSWGNSIQVESVEVGMAADLTTSVVVFSGLNENTVGKDNYTLGLLAADTYRAISSPQKPTVKMIEENNSSQLFSEGFMVLEVKGRGEKEPSMVQVTKTIDADTVQFNFTKGSVGQSLHLAPKLIEASKDWKIAESTPKITDVFEDDQGRPTFFRALRDGIYKADQHQFSRDAGSILAKSVDNKREEAVIHELVGIKEPGDEISAKGMKHLEQWCADVIPNAVPESVLNDVTAVCSQGFFADGNALVYHALNPNDQMPSVLVQGVEATPRFELNSSDVHLQVIAEREYALVDLNNMERMGSATTKTIADLGTNTTTTEVELFYDNNMDSIIKTEN